jgi:hypothetical protein
MPYIQYYNILYHTIPYHTILYHTQLKTIRLLQYWWKQDWTMFCCPHCSQLSTILNISIFAQVNITNHTSWLVKFDVLSCHIHLQVNITNPKFSMCKCVSYTDKEISEIKIYSVPKNTKILKQLFASGSVIIGEYSPRLRLGEYSPIITSSSANNCEILLHPIQAQQYSILLTSVNNVSSKTLFNPVKQRAQRLYACTTPPYTAPYHTPYHAQLWWLIIPEMQRQTGT